jgi:hypothetical protein
MPCVNKSDATILHRRENEKMPGINAIEKTQK